MKFQIYGGVKIKSLNILLGLFLVLLMVPMVSAQIRSDSVGDNSFPFNESFLIITAVDVKVCNDRCKTDKDLDHRDDISDEAEPGGRVEFKIEVANIFPEDSDIEIEDIEIEITIEDIDDGDDLDADDEFDDLDPGDDDKVTISFDIPLEVEDDTFDVLIEIDGRSKNGTQRAQMELTLEVQKERNEVRFTRNTLTPSEVKCSRTVQLSTGVINTGEDDEDDTILEIENAELGVSIREIFDLSNDPFDDDSKFSKTYTFTVPENIAQGIYSMLSRVTFNNGRDVETETADLVVGTCETVKPVVEEEEEEEEKEDVVVVKPPVTTTPTITGTITAQPVTTPTLPTTKEESFFETTGFLVVLIAGEVLLVLIAILIIFAVARRRRD